MLATQLTHVNTILCIGAHADDIEVGCGGTILRLLAERTDARVHWVVFSAQGMRRDEAIKSAEIFLAMVQEKEIVVRDFRDSFFPYQGEMIKEYFHDISRRISPDVIFTHRREDAHQDHRTLAELTWCAFRNHLILEYEIPKYEGDLGRPNVYVPLAEDVCRSKVDTTVDSFVTQQEKSWFTRDTFWSQLRIRGIECNSPSGYAEAFCCRKLILV